MLHFTRLAAAGCAALSIALIAPTSTSLADQSASPRELWITAQGQDEVAVLALPGEETVERVSLPAGTQPHITTFSPSGAYAYVSGMGNGQLLVVRAADRKIVQALPLYQAGVHQARVSPDGASVLVAVVASKTLVRLAADESAETWTVDGDLSFAPIGKAPICTVYRDDGQQAYVSLQPSGLAIVDVPSMSIVDGVLPVTLRAAGQVALIDVASLHIRAYIPVAAPAEFNPATCIGCAVHGVTMRPAGPGR